jgi:hypothetical protein
MMDELFIPETDVEIEIIEGETGAEKARNLVDHLRAEGLL